jgi:uncharacterized protein (TIRG00374 family)
MRLIMSAILLLILLLTIDRQALLEAVLGVDLALYVAGLLIFVLANVVWAYRWSIIIRASGENVALHKVIATTYIGVFFSMFLPTAVGADIGRMSQMSDDGKPSARIVSTVLLDRLIGLISLVLMAVLALVVGFQYAGEQGIVLAVLGGLVALVVGWLLFFNRSLMRRFHWVFKLPGASRLEDPIRKLYTSLHYLQSQPRLVLTTVAVSFVMQSIEVISVIFIARASAIDVPFIYFFLFLPVIWVITTIPISISGLGLREGVFVFFFSQVGVTPSDAVAMSLLFYVYRVIVGVSGGMVMMTSSARRVRLATSEGSLDPARLDRVEKG